MTLPVSMVARRLARELAERDYLLSLLGEVADAHQLTNRLGEAVVLLPESVMNEINYTLGRRP